MEQLSMDNVKSPLLKTSKDNTSESESALAEGTKIDVDVALELIGSWGTFNVLLLLAMMFCNLGVAYQLSFSYFIGNDPSWKCNNMSNNSNNPNNHSSTFCSRNQGRNIHIDEEDFYERCNVTREIWTYTTDKQYSYTTEFDLVCDRQTLSALLSAAFFCGFIFQLIVGPLVDMYGRRLTVVIVLFSGTCISIGCSYVTEVWQLIFLRVLLGAAFITSMNSSFLLLTEFTTPASRSLIACVYLSISTSISHLLVAVVAYYTREWRQLNLYASLLSIPGLLVILFAPRSPRWLLEKGKISEAEHVIQKAVQWNGNREIDFSLKPSSKSNVKTYTYLDLLCKWKPLRMTLCLALIYVTIGMIFYEVALEADHLGADIYITYALSAIVDVPGQFIAFYLCDRVGRKKTVLTGLIISGVMMGSIALVPEHYTDRHSARMALAMLSKVTVSAANFGIFIWGFESYPTLLRSQGGTICVVMHQLGVICVPLLESALQSIHPLLIYIILCLLSVFASVIGCTLNETNKLPTRKTYEDLLLNE